VEIGGQKISTRGDVAAFGIGYAVGYVIDNYFFPGGLSGGVVAAVSATGSVGVKNFLHVLWGGRGEKEDDFRGDPLELEQQAEKLLRYIEKIVDRSQNPKEHPLRPALENYERMFIFWRNGLIDVDEFYNRSFLPARKVFREHLSAVSYVWVET